jgi:hypothetical protein
MDRDGDLARPYDSPGSQAAPATLHQWTFLGWIALANVHKYLTRGSLWEALAQLDQARDVVWKLWGARHHVEFPAYGLTSVLEAPEVGVPPGIQATLAQLDEVEITRAAIRVAGLLMEVSAEADASNMARHTLQRLTTFARGKHLSEK